MLRNANRRLVELLNESKKSVEEFSEKTARLFASYEDRLQKILETIADIEESHSGSWLGYHAYLYYSDFEKPPLESRFDVEWGRLRGIPPGWQEKSYDDVAEFVRRRHRRTDVDSINESLHRIRSEAGDLRSRIVADLSCLRDLEGFHREGEMLDRIEKLELTVAANKWTQEVTPKSLITRDSTAAARGPVVPPHIRYRSVIMQLLSTVLCVRELTRQCIALLRQVEVKLLLGKQTQETTDPRDAIVLICNSFHSVAKQLLQRHDNRETLALRDEYDVQDLLHALLLVFFDDVRREEYTPSYAGSSSRMDILLKVATTVVEAKYNLPNKQLRNQLLVDIASYRQHKDCRTLICFVYDPEGRVQNPRGFERDLGTQSTKDFEVVVLVRPS
jgi:hypothetical protein